MNLNRLARLGLVLSCLLIPARVCAEEPVWPKNYLDGATRKLGRGVANLLTAPLELVRKPRLTERTEGGLSALTVGVAQGVKAAILRGGAGVVETVTWLLPVPDARFQPLVHPEFIYAHGDWSPDAE